MAIKEYYNIGEFSDLFGINTQTLYYYDHIGLLKPRFRDPDNGRRQYYFDQVFKLASIRFMRKLDYSIDQIQEYSEITDYRESLEKLRMHSVKMQEQWKNKEYREKRITQTKKQWENEEYRNIMSGEKSVKWKGGITPISKYLRDLNEQWFDDCKKQANYVCQLTGKKGQLHTHHLKAFSIIVLDAHKLHNIKIKKNIAQYTNEELKLLEEYVASWHKDSSNAVVLSDDVHRLFHSLYGQGSNTPEQFEEFKERYLAGEFKEILK